MHRLLYINKQERGVAIIVAAALLFLHALMLMKYWSLLSTPTEWAHITFARNFHLSGYDPYVYDLVTDGTMNYKPLRHPLIHLLCMPLLGLNQLLWWLTGSNCAMAIVAVAYTVCGVYIGVWLWRILRHAMALSPSHAAVLTALFFSLAYVLVPLVVADHFCLSLFMLMLTLWRSAWKVRRGETFGWMEAAVLMILTGGITLTNAALVAIMVLCVCGSTFFRWRMLLFGMALPSAFLLACGIIGGMGSGDMAVAASWVDTSVARLPTLWHNVFGESWQMHRDHFLGDALIDRPLFVHYRWWWQYAVEVFLIASFLWGAWLGRRDRLAWLLYACLLFNALLHLLLGFGINEVYIMTPHWAYALPLLLAYAVHRHGWWLSAPLALSALYMLSYHGYLLWYSLTWPLRYSF